MGGGQDDAKGPDLRKGVPLGDLPDGEPFGGQVDGNAVVLVRRGEEVLAIGGTCTHYGGPLADGLVVGDTVRCPWHDACFSLRTGEALGAPALNSVRAWRTEVRDDRVYVTGDPEDPGPLAARGRTPRADAPETVVIVGAGAAGSAAGEMLRRQGHAGRIVMVDPDEAAPYDRPNLSKDFLAGSAPEEWIPLRQVDFYAEHGIERVASRAVALDPGAKRLELADGATLAFDALLLATGARPIRLNVPGADMPHVRTLRSLADCRAIIEAAGDEGGRAVVVGASFIGMETANALRERGLEVTVVAPESLPFEKTLGTKLGSVLKTLHEENGVQFRLGRAVDQIERDRVRLDDGERLGAKLVLVGIGVRPETGLAESAGLHVDDGVVVDAFLETASPGIYAAGDIARWPEPRSRATARVEHWVLAQRLGQAAARNMVAQRKPFLDVPFFWTRQWNVSVTYVGYAPSWQDVEVLGDPADHDCEVRYRRDGKVLAVATIGRNRARLEWEARMEAAAI